MGWSICRGFGELSDEPEYEATIATDPYGDFSVTRWLWVFQDLHRGGADLNKWPSGSVDAAACVRGGVSVRVSGSSHSHYVKQNGTKN